VGEKEECDEWAFAFLTGYRQTSLFYCSVHVFIDSPNTYRVERNHEVLVADDESTSKAQTKSTPPVPLLHVA
jgi:hypothetical protein